MSVDARGIARRLVRCAAALAVLGAVDATAAVPCAGLATLVLPDTTILSAADEPGGAYCQVKGVVAPANRFEVWLPVAWNGKFQGVGNGGLGGYINYSAMTLAVARGYATAGTDGGHAGSPLDASWALGHPELVEDFGHRGVHVVTVAAKAVAEAFYGTAPERSYFVGCSSGGKQGLTEVQRYPDDYDGAVVGAPAYFFTHLSMASNWVAQALHEDPDSRIPPATLAVIADAVVARCDGLDGVRDGLLSDPRRCRFNPARLRCKGAPSPACLTEAQVRGLRKIYAGPRTKSGRRLYPGFVPGGEIGSGTALGPAGDPNVGGWEAWIGGTTANLAVTIQDTFFRFMAFEDPAWDWRTFDFDGDVRTTDAKLAAILDATDPDLSRFASRGGKIVMFHGWSDPAISPLGSIDYLRRVVPHRRRDDFIRLFLAPGMQHCAGGPGPSSFDAVGALERWIEQGVAPERIVAEHRTNGAVDRTRPLCPYPRAARWDGVGDPDDAASFVCR